MPPRGPELPYQRVLRELREYVLPLAPDSTLPAVPDLAERFATSRETIRRAERQLAGEGLLLIVPKWGTFRTGERADP